MATGHIMMAMTLDGFVARSDHSLDWLLKQPTQDEDHGFEAFLDSVDVLVMGSGSLKTVLSFDEWPYTKPVVVANAPTANGGQHCIARVADIKADCQRQRCPDGRRRASVPGAR